MKKMKRMILALMMKTTMILLRKKIRNKLGISTRMILKYKMQNYLKNMLKCKVIM